MAGKGIRGLNEAMSALRLTSQLCKNAAVAASVRLHGKHSSHNGTVN